MRIIYIVPGSGDTFYCQNCVRDAAFIRALRALGHDVVMVPLYLPLLVEGRDLARGSPVFYGAVRLYLEELFPFLRRLPRRLASLLDARPLLRWVARRASSTRAHGLENLTLSVLRGEHGRQVAELKTLLTWLAGEPPCDVIHLSNSLLLGLARPLRAALQIPVVCSLQDEDEWVDSMNAKDAALIWEVMADCAVDVSAFLAVSPYFAKRIQPRLRIPEARLHVVCPGIRVEEYVPSSLPFTPRAIGYLSRMSEDCGLGILVDAFLALRQDKRLRQVRLYICGGMTRDDRRFLAGIQAKLAADNAQGHVKFLPDFDRNARTAFLQSLTLLSVPALKETSSGTYLLEAMAAGVPVVQPAIGGFTNIVERTGGGILYEPNTPEKLAEALRGLLLDLRRTRELGQSARAGVATCFGVEKMAMELVEIYQGVARKT